jgi:DHA1 family bicyclomycin/chloramphenicol resistance-like MFS transporter
LVLVAATNTGGLWALLVPLWLGLAGAGLVMPNASAMALTRHGEAAGTAAAVAGFLQFGVGAVMAPLVGALGATGLAMAAVMAVALLAGLGCLLFVVRPDDLAYVEDGVQPAGVH